MITAHEVETAGFRRAARGSVGYDEDAVDDFLDRVVETLSAIERGGERPAKMLSARDVVDVIFTERGPHASGGYDLDDVDDLLDRVAQRIHVYEEGLRHAADPTAGKAPIQHVAFDDRGCDEAAAHDGSRDGAQDESREAARDDAHVVTPLEQVREGRGEAETPAVADLDRQDDQVDAGAGAAASAGALGATAVEQKRAPAARDHHDEHDLQQADAARAQTGADDRGDMTEVIDVAQVSSVREDDAAGVAPVRSEPVERDEAERHEAERDGVVGDDVERADVQRGEPLAAEPQTGAGSATQGATAQQGVVAPTTALTQQTPPAQEATQAGETASTSSDEPADDSLVGINIVGGRPLDEVGTDTHDRPGNPSDSGDSVASSPADEAPDREDAVSPEESFDAERRDDQVAAPVSETGTADAPATDAPAADTSTVGAEPSRPTTNLSKSTRADVEPDDRQVNDQEEHVVVKQSGGTPSVTPLEADEAGGSDDEHGEEFESFTSASAGAFAEPGVREPAETHDDTPERAHDDASAEAAAEAPRAAERATAQGLTVRPTEARLATDPGVTGEQSRRLDAAWRAAVPQADEEKEGIISYPATDHRVPLPRGEARREVSAQDREAESQFHPEFSSYASHDAPVVPEPQGAPEPQAVREQQEQPAQQGADDERGHVRIVGCTGDVVPERLESGSASDAVSDEEAVSDGQAPQHDDEAQHEHAPEERGARRDEDVQNSSPRPAVPEVPSDRPADEHEDAEGAWARDDAAPLPADTRGDVESHGVENHNAGQGRQDDDFDPFAARSAVADEPLTSTVETPSGMRSMSSEAPEEAEPGAPASPAQPVHHTSTEAPIAKEPASMTTEDGHELQHAHLDDDRAEPTPQAEPIERPESIERPQGIDTARDLPARDDSSRKGLLRRIFKG